MNVHPLKKKDDLLLSSSMSLDYFTPCIKVYKLFIFIKRKAFFAPKKSE